MSVSVTITHPNDGDTLNQTNLQVLVTATTDVIGATIIGGTVTINGGTPLSMVWDATLNSWKKFLSIPNGSVQAVVTMQDSTGASGSDTITFSNGAATGGPVIAWTFPTATTVVNQTGQTAIADVSSPIGIDPTSVQFSTDNGVTWLTGSLTPSSVPGGGG